MTGDRYPILHVSPGQVLEEEAMGSKQKFWFRWEDDVECLFKYPQAHTGQHWAEKIAAEVADDLGIFHAAVELALFQGVKGSATRSFARDGRELYHGNQVLAGQLLDYDPEKRFHQSEHTLENILAALDRVLKTPEAAHRAKLQIAEYLVLDAVIGNTDRHHENWGILRKRTEHGWTGWLAPTFDHASSLGRELRDESRGKCRRRLLDEDRIGDYSERAPGAIYWETTDRRGLSPLALLRRAAERYPALFIPSLGRLGVLTEDRLTHLVRRVPEDWMSETARDFTIKLMCYNIAELRKIAP